MYPDEDAEPKKQLTVAELILLLGAFQPDMEVRVAIGCCSGAPDWVFVQKYGTDVPYVCIATKEN